MEYSKVMKTEFRKLSVNVLTWKENRAREGVIHRPRMLEVPAPEWEKKSIRKNELWLIYGTRLIELPQKKSFA